MMKRDFILRTQDTDVVVARKNYMTLEQAFVGFKKAARTHLGDSATWVSVPEQLFTGYYRNPRGDVLEMR
jgi:hypothetical protein